MRSEQLQYLPFFRDIDIASLSQLAEHSFTKHCNKGDLLFLHGDDTQYFYIISSGWLKLFRDTLRPLHEPHEFRNNLDFL